MMARIEGDDETDRTHPGRRGPASRESAPGYHRAMSRTRAVLVTGAGGEIGHGLIDALSARHESLNIIALDLRPLAPELAARCAESIEGSILDKEILEGIISRHAVTEIHHLAALLSTSGEKRPELAHEVNVNGTLLLLDIARKAARAHGEPVRFFFPSSIAAHGLPEPARREELDPVPEEQHLDPITVYGCNKLYCEHMGRYHSEHYRMLDPDEPRGLVDFRSLRFPGLLSAFTAPSGGTSDYAPEIIHAGAKGEPYACFVPAETRLPFMAMPDAVQATLDLMAAPLENLSRRVYNLSAFAPTAEDFRVATERAFPGLDVRYEPDTRRFPIVASWPARVDDARARRDWGFAPRLDFDACFAEYLVPNLPVRDR